MAIPSIPDLPNPAEGIRGTTCVDLETRLDNQIRIIEQARTAINAPTKLLNQELGKLIGGPASSAAELLGASNEIQNKVNDGTPGLPDTASVEDMLKDCGILQDDILNGKTSPAAAIGAFLEAAGNALADALSKALEAISNLLEAPAAALVEAINSILKKIKIPDVLGLLDEILACLDSVCNGNLTNKVDYINALTSDMKLDDSGLIDLDTIASEAGISGDQLANIKELGTTVTNAKASSEEQAKTAGSALGDSIKTLITPPPAAQKVISFFS